jgi:hypothetical protein
MMRNGTLFLLGLFTLAMQSCFKEDEMVPAHPRGNVNTDTIAMTENYRYQVYFSLDSGSAVSSNVKTISDLGFECSGEGWHVILNTSDFMKAADLGEVVIGASHDTNGVKWKFDKSDGNPDSNAIGHWYNISGNDTVSNNHVYAINRGLDELGNTLGIYQVIFDSLKHNTYYFRYAPLKGGTVIPGSVTKQPGINYLYYGLKSGTVEELEPKKPFYDLFFTQYTTLLFTDEGIAYPYLVTGVLSNPYQVEVAADSIHDFFAITHETIQSSNFSKNLDAIGYDWKYYSFTSGSYTIRPNRNYIVHTVSGQYFKLRFIGFYDRNGAKGYPVIEYELL